MSERYTLSSRGADMPLKAQLELITSYGSGKKTPITEGCFRVTQDINLEYCTTAKSAAQMSSSEENGSRILV